MTRTVTVDAHVTVPHEPEDLWPFVADVNRMDHAVGLPPARFTRTRRPEGGDETWGEYRRWGVPIARWREYPFEWERPRRYAVVREYASGPIRRFFGGADMTATDSGTSIRVFAEFTPRSVVFVPMIRLWVAPVTMRRARRQYLNISTFLTGQTADPFPFLATDKALTGSQHLDACVQRLESQDVAPEPLARLQRLVAEGADEEASSMRPIQLAGLWRTDDRETLKAFIKATEAGLLEMRWELLCPSCRGVKADARHLKELNLNGYCAACNLPFAVTVDEGVEARFYPHPAIRKIESGTYCVGSPMNTPHRLAQTNLLPLETRDWTVHLAPGPYLVRSPQSRNVVRLQVKDAEQSGPVEVLFASDSISPASAIVGPNSVLRLINTSDIARTVAIDDEQWSETAATPGRLLTIPDFNALFSAEALAPDIELAVGRIGILFSDLAGSTSLYERAGEALAFRLVNEHFQILRQSIDDAGGSMVKTIGDAVMAAFPDGAGALSAGLAIQRNIRRLETRGLVDPAKLVKVGVHCGPSYLVTLNDRLDYFGTTVNVAARAQHEARGGEIVASADVMLETPDLTRDQALAVIPFRAAIQGISEPREFFRIICSAPGRPIDQGQIDV